MCGVGYSRVHYVALAVHHTCPTTIEFLSRIVLISAGSELLICPVYYITIEPNRSDMTVDNHYYASRFCGLGIDTVAIPETVTLPPMSVFNPSGKPFGDPSCLQCALCECLDVNYDRDTLQYLTREKLLDDLNECSIFFADAAAYSDRAKVAYYARVLARFLHVQSHQPTVDRFQLMKSYTCFYRMHMVLTHYYPRDIPPWPSHYYNDYVRKVAEYSAETAMF